MVKFKIFDIEIVDKNGLLDALEIPHPLNDHTFGDKPVKHIQQRSIELPDMSFEVLIIWEGDIAPTDQEIIKQARDEYGYDEDDEEP